MYNLLVYACIFVYIRLAFCAFAIAFFTDEEPTLSNVLICMMEGMTEMKMDLDELAKGFIDFSGIIYGQYGGLCLSVYLDLVFIVGFVRRRRRLKA